MKLCRNFFSISTGRGKARSNFNNFHNLRKRGISCGYNGQLTPCRTVINFLMERRGLLGELKWIRRRRGNICTCEASPIWWYHFVTRYVCMSSRVYTFRQAFLYEMQISSRTFVVTLKSRPNSKSRIIMMLQHWCNYRYRANLPPRATPSNYLILMATINNHVSGLSSRLLIASKFVHVTIFISLIAKIININISPNDCGKRN